MFIPPSETLNPPVRLLAAFQRTFPACAPEWIVRAPGRDVWAAACRARAEQFCIASADDGARAVFTLRSARLKRTAMQRPLPRWARCPVSVLVTLHDAAAAAVIGFNCVLASAEPAGPTYDYGLGLAAAALWHEIHAVPYTTDRLIEAVDRARRAYL